IFGLSFDKQVSTTLTADLPMPATLGPMTVTAGGEVAVSAGGHFGIGIGYNFADQAPFVLVDNQDKTLNTDLTLGAGFNAGVDIDAAIGGLKAGLVGTLQLRRSVRDRREATNVTSIVLSQQPTAASQMLVFITPAGGTTPRLLPERETLSDGTIKRNFTLDGKTLTFTESQSGLIEVQYAAAGDTA